MSSIAPFFILIHCFIKRRQPICNSSARPIRKTHLPCVNPVLELFSLKACVRPKLRAVILRFGTFLLEKLVFDPNWGQLPCVLELFSLKSLCSTQTAGSYPAFWNLFPWKACVRPKLRAVTLHFGTFLPEKLAFDPNCGQLPCILELFSLKNLRSTQTEDSYPAFWNFSPWKAEITPTFLK